MLHICYLRNGSVFMPLLARTEAGFYKWIDPIAVVPVASTAELHQALADVIACGNPIIPTPKPNNDPVPATLKQAGVKTWKAWERSTTCWKLSENDGVYQIVGQKEGRHGGWVDDHDQTIKFPSGTSADRVIDRLIEILQAAAQGEAE
jgi:hypothetical protein